MSRVETAPAMDRLPWLPDEPAPKAVRRRQTSLLGPAVAAVLIVGGTAFWFGARSEDQIAPASRTPPHAAVVKLPTVQPAVPPRPEAGIQPAPQVEPIVAPPMPVIEPPAPPKPLVRRPSETADLAPPAPEAAPAVEPPPAPAQLDRPQAWPVRVVDGAAGRLVRIGAFSSVHQAKRGWWAIVRVNPALKHLDALVVPVQSLRDGRVYYRLQMGTTSQAHSTVLCQRMRMIAQPCVVIGLVA